VPFGVVDVKGYLGDVDVDGAVEDCRKCSIVSIHDLLVNLLIAVSTTVQITNTIINR
jgi:hypothetical protein